MFKRLTTLFLFSFIWLLLFPIQTYAATTTATLKGVSGGISCFGEPGFGSYGTVQLTRNGNNLTAVINVTGGMPNTTFSVELWEADNSCGSDNFADTGTRLTTDSSGNGSTTVSIGLPHTSLGTSTLGDGAGTEQVVIALDNSLSAGAGDVYTMAATPLPSIGDPDGDHDGDGIPNKDDPDYDHDGDGIPNTEDPDYDPNPENNPPVVQASDDFEGESGKVYNVGAIVADDGRPIPSDQLQITWSKASGPGSVVFGTPNQNATSVKFDKPGAYVIRVSVSDTELTQLDEIHVQITDLYYVELKAWIPHNKIVDPLLITDFKFPNIQVPFMRSALKDCFAPVVAAGGVKGQTKVIQASFHGDNHTQFGLLNSPGKDYRIQSWVTFRFDGEKISEFRESGGYGTTTREVVIEGKNSEPVTCRQTALEDFSTLKPSVQVDDTNFKMSVVGFNPLVPKEGENLGEFLNLCLLLGQAAPVCDRVIRSIPFVPAIDGELTAKINPDGELSFNYKTDWFPSYGIGVQKNNKDYMKNIIHDASCVNAQGYAGAANVLTRLQTTLGLARNTGTVTKDSPNALCFENVRRVESQAVEAAIRPAVNNSTEPLMLMIADILPN